MNIIVYFISFLLILFGLGAYGQEIDTAFIKSNYSKKEVYIPMRDGVRLFTTIYEPIDVSVDYPLLMIRTPYSAAPYGAGNYKLPLGPSANYAKEGFVFVYQDVRGKYMSEGEFVANRPLLNNSSTNESTDTYDTIDWLVNNIKSNKKVGVWGVSAPGLYASMSLINSHPALKAVSPQAPVTDWFLGDDRHYNGAFLLMGSFSFLSSFGKQRDSIGTRHPGGFYNYQTTDSYNFYLETGALKNFNKKYLQGKSVLWNEMMENPDYNSYWENRSYLKHIKQVNSHVLLVGGWFDQEDLYGPLKTYAHLNKHNSDNLHFVMGPWYHGSWTRFEGDSLGQLSFESKTGRFYRENIELPFFKKHLKGSSADLQPVTIFYTGANKWRNHDTWPPVEANMKSIYLKDSKKLSFIKPMKEEGDIGYWSDPAKPVPYTNEKTVYRGYQFMFEDQHFAGKRPDVLVFESDVLEQDVTIAGNIMADLFVSSSGTDADFIVKLIDFHPFKVGSAMSDYQLMVRGGVMRAKYRHSFAKPEPLTANKVERVKFDLQDAAHTFKKGHKIVVQIQSSWFPLVDRNPQQFLNIYEAEDSDFLKQFHTIYFNKNYPSSIVLPIVDNNEE